MSNILQRRIGGPTGLAQAAFATPIFLLFFSSLFVDVNYGNRRTIVIVNILIVVNK